MCRELSNGERMKVQKVVLKEEELWSVRTLRKSSALLRVNAVKVVQK